MKNRPDINIDFNCFTNNSSIKHLNIIYSVGADPLIPAECSD